MCPGIGAADLVAASVTESLPGIRRHVIAEILGNRRFGSQSERHVATIAEVRALGPTDVPRQPMLPAGRHPGSLVVGARLVVHARPERVARAVFRDSDPSGAGGGINDRLSVEGDEIPFPPWDSFEVAEHVDLLTGHGPRTGVARKVRHCAPGVPRAQRRRVRVPHWSSFRTVGLSERQRMVLPAGGVTCRRPTTGREPDMPGSSWRRRRDPPP